MKTLLFLLFPLMFLSQEKATYPMFDDFYDGVGLNTDQKKILVFYQHKKFENPQVFFSSLDKIASNKLFTPTEIQKKCFEYYFKLEEQTGDLKELQKYNNFEIFMFAEGQCYIRDELADGY